MIYIGQYRTDKYKRDLIEIVCLTGNIVWILGRGYKESRSFTRNEIYKYWEIKIE